MRIEDFAVLCETETMTVSAHCAKRMIQRGIALSDIKQAILTGEIIEDYPTDYPFHSCLILGNNLHIVASIGQGMIYLITVYRPDPAEWDDDLRTRRK